MKLTEEYVKRNEQELVNHYSPWHTKCKTWLQYLRGEYPVIVPEKYKPVFPPIARRVVFGLAQQIRIENRHVHCKPAQNTQGRDTKEAQSRSSERENFHRAAFAQDDTYALRQRRYPPGIVKLIEMLLFGLSAGMVLPNELAIGPEPDRRAGEGRLDFDKRHRLWEMRRMILPALPCHTPGILNLLIDPSGEWFIWKSRLAVETAKAIAERWGKGDEIPGSLTQDRMVDWKECYSDENRLVYCGDRLLKEVEGYGFLPLTSALACKGEPMIYNTATVGSSGPEHQYAGILAGCESILDDIARKESQIANWISRRVWPKVFIQSANLPPKWQPDWDPAKLDQLPLDAKLISPEIGDLPADAWKSIVNSRSYIDSISQIDALQGYRQANSGYEQAILGGLAGAVLKPYVDGLDLDETQVAELRGMYVYASDLMLDGLNLGARLNGQWVSGSLKREDMDSLHVEVVHEFRLPQQRITEEAFYRDAMKATEGKAFALSGRTYLERGVGIEDPEAEAAQSGGEQFMESPEIRAVKQREFAYAWDADLGRRLEEEQAASMEQIAGAIQQNQGAPAAVGMGGEGLAPPGAGLPVAAPIRVVGQPTPARTPEQDIDLIARQAARRKMPVRAR